MQLVVATAGARKAWAKAKDQALRPSKLVVDRAATNESPWREAPHRHPGSVHTCAHVVDFICIWPGRNRTTVWQQGFGLEHFGIVTDVNLFRNCFDFSCCGCINEVSVQETPKLATDTTLPCFTRGRRCHTEGTKYPFHASGEGMGCETPGRCECLRIAKTQRCSDFYHLPSNKVKVVCRGFFGSFVRPGWLRRRFYWLSSKDLVPQQSF